MKNALHFSALHRALRNFLALSLMLLAFMALPVEGLGQNNTTISVLTLDCATPAPTGSTSTGFSDTTAVKTFLNSAAGLSDAQNKITCSAKTGDVYKGKGSGGGNIPQQCLKVGKASGGGSFTFTIPTTYDNIDAVELTCYGWKTTSSISINGGTAQTFDTAQIQKKKTFELASSTRTISISVTTSAVCITEIVLKKNDGTTPSITASNVDIAYNATGGSIAYTLNNANGNVEATVTSGDWLTLGTVSETTVPFTCSANPTTAARTATVTLSYTGATNKVISVTQSGNPNVVDNISDITESGTSYKVKGTVLAKSARAFVLGDGTGYAYFYNGYTAPSQNVNDIVTIEGTVTTYGHILQFPNTSTITETESSNFNGSPEATVITEIPTTTYSTGLHLSDYFQFEGTLTKSSGYYYVAVGEGQINISYPSTTQQTTMNNLENKTVRVKGFFAGITSANYFSVLMESIEEVIGEVATPTFSPAAGTYDEAQNVTLNCATDGSTIYYTTDGTNPTNESTLYTTAINVANTTTIKAIAYVGEDYSTIATATYTIVSLNNISDITEGSTAYSVKGTVVATNSRGFVMGDGTGYVYYYKNAAPTQTVNDKVKISGTTGTYGQIIQFTNSATVTEAATSNYDETPAATLITEVPDYSTGYHLSTYLEFEGILTKSGSNYLITLGESQIQISYPTTDQGTALTALSDKTVHVKGYFTGINSSSKFTVMLESIEEVIIPTIAVAPKTVNVPFAGEDDTLTVTYENITTVVAEVFFCDAQGEAATYDWITAEINTDNNVEYIIEANDGEARTAYLKVRAFDDNVEYVYSNLVTITQAEYVAPTYAALPFAFDNGQSSIESTDGLYQEGLGSDYGSSPKLKFDGTGDWLLLQFAERPGTLTFKIKGNGYSSGSTSTFKVQASTDGTVYTDLATYTELGDTKTESFDNLGENVRYIKWIYTEKGATNGGNVALGDITLAKYIEPEPSITVDPATVNAETEETEGYLGIAYVNLNITDANAFGIQFYDDNNQELSGNDEPDWVTAEVTTQTGEQGYFVYYFISDNNSEARTAYFKVWALNNTEAVFSNLVTITQAASSATMYTVNFYAGNGTCDTTNKEGYAETHFTLPEATPYIKCSDEGWIFAGWATENVSETQTAPTLLTGDYTIQGDADLYAVYSLAEGDAEQTIIFNFDTIAKKNSWVSNTRYETITIGDVTLTATGATTINGKYYSTDKTWRVYSTTDPAGGVMVTSVGNNVVSVTSNPTATFTITNGSASFTASSNTAFKEITVTCNSSSTTYNSNPVCLETVVTPAISPEGGSYTEAQNVTIECETPGATIYYTTDGTEPSSTNGTAYTSAIPVNESMTIKAIAVKEGMNAGAIASATYIITQPSITLSPSTIEAPVADTSGSLEMTLTAVNASTLEIQWFDEDGDLAEYDPTTWLHLTVNASSIDYVIDENKSYLDRDAYFKVVGKDADNNDVLSNLVAVTQTHPDAPEKTITVNPTSANHSSAAANGSSAVTIENFTIGEITEAFFAFYNSDGNGGYTEFGEEEDDPAWIHPSIESPYETLSYTVDANEGEARTAYFKLVFSLTGEYVYSDIITVSQEEYVIDYATLPFEWAGGTSGDLTALNGVTGYSLGDYAAANAPYRTQFNATGDYIQVKCDQQPGKVTIGVKMVGGNSTSSIIVQGSTDGTNFANIDTLTISGSQNDILTLETTKAFDANDRYVRFYFKKGSNVGVGPITIAIPVPTCTIEPTSWDFGNVQAGSTAQTKQFTVTTTYLTNDLTVSFLENNAYYTTDVTTIASTATSTTITVTLNPTVVGSMDNYLIISGDDFEEDIEVKLTATGLCNAPTAALAYTNPEPLTLSGDDVEYTLTPTAETGNGGDISYEVTTNPENNAEITNNNTFYAIATGTYVVTATQAVNGTTCGGTATLTIQVVSPDPSCTINDEAFDFGNVDINSSKEQTFTITTANLTGDVTLSMSDEAFTVSPATIQQGATETEITITFTPTSAGSANAYLTANGGGISNDALALVEGTGIQTYTVSFDAGTGGTFEGNDTTGSSIDLTGITALPSELCQNQGWTFTGWSETEVSENTTAPTLVSNSYSPTGNITLHAVYQKTEGFDNTTGGEFYIYATVGSTNYYAKGTGSKLSSTTTASEATLYTFEKPNGYNNGEFAIKAGDYYVTYSSSTNLGTSTSTYKWTISQGTKGTWRISSGTSGRALVYRAGSTNQFGGYSTNNVTADGTEYFDLEIGGSSSTIYNSNPDCTIYSVNLTQTEGGTISANPTSATAGTEITLTAETAEGYSFNNEWSVTSGNNSITVTNNKFTMPAGDVNVTVTYSVNSYTITYMNGEEQFTSQTYDYNAAVSAPQTNPSKTGYTFVGWSPALPGNMPAEDLTVNAQWNINSHNLTIHYIYSNQTAAAEDYTATLDYGASYNVASPTIEGYTPDKATISGTMPDEDVEVTVTYGTDIHTLTIHYVYAAGGTAHDDVESQVAYGSDYSIASPAITGYTPDNATVNGTMGTENVEVTVTYSVNSYTITTNTNPTTGGTVEGAGNYNHFENITLTATANTGYYFVNWTDGDEAVSTSTSYSFQVNGARTLVANFDTLSYDIAASAKDTVIVTLWWNIGVCCSRTWE